MRADLEAVIIDACDRLALDYRIAEVSIIEHGKCNDAIHRDLDKIKSIGAFNALA